MTKSTQIVRITRCKIVEIRVIRYGIVIISIVGCFDISNIVVMVVMAVIAVLTDVDAIGILNILDMYASVASSRMLDRAVIVTKVGVLMYLPLCLLLSLEK